MSAKDDIKRFARQSRVNLETIYRGSKRAAFNSIKYGSMLTGAPGQPVGEGDLRESWQMEDEDPMVALIYTESPYALSNEDGIARPGGGPYVLRSSEGGRWSVHKTRTNFERLVDDIARKLLNGRRIVR